jgi:hypothetical protein
MKLLPHQAYLATLKRPWAWDQMLRRPAREQALRELRNLTGQDFGDDVEKWQEWIEQNVETFYASGSNGVRYTILGSTEITSTGDVQELLRTPQGIAVIRIEKGKYQMQSEFYGDQILTTFDPNQFEN